MKKYFLAVVSLFSLTHAFAESGAFVNVNFVDNEGEIEFHAEKGRTLFVKPIRPSIYLDPGMYGIMISNGKGMCLQLSIYLEGGEKYTITSSNKKGCSMQKTTLKPITKGK